MEIDCKYCQYCDGCKDDIYKVAPCRCVAEVYPKFLNSTKKNRYQWPTDGKFHEKPWIEE